MRTLSALVLLATVACATPSAVPTQIVLDQVSSRVDRAEELLDRVQPLAVECAKPSLVGDGPCSALVDAFAASHVAVARVKHAVTLGKDVIRASGDLMQALDALLRAVSNLPASDESDAG